jgi:uncharacterized integral membrane protein (TIGR00697 family)
MLDSQTESANKVILSRSYTQFKFFFMILTLFTSTWLTSNIAAVKLVSVFGITLTGGFIIFPFTTMFGCIIVEVYGYKNARQALWSGFILNLTFIFFINLIYIFPSSPCWNLSDQFKDVLLPETRIVVASLISFLMAEFLNSYLMAKMKIWSHGRSLVKRILVSCGFSFLFDIIFFLTLAFYGSMENSILIKLILYAYLKKTLCQAALFPLICYVISVLKRAEAFEVYDYNTKFIPFSLDNVYELSAFVSVRVR